MKYFEKNADLKEWVEDKSDVLDKIHSPKIKLLQSIAKEEWTKRIKKLKDLVIRKYNTLKDAIIE